MKNKTVRKLVFVTGLAIAAITSLPADSQAAKMCDYEYYYDAAKTQWAGYCSAACYAGGNVCTGDVTAYYSLVNCRPQCMPEEW